MALRDLLASLNRLLGQGAGAQKPDARSRPASRSGSSQPLAGTSRNSAATAPVPAAAPLGSLQPAAAPADTLPPAVPQAASAAPQATGPGPQVADPAPQPADPMPQAEPPAQQPAGSATQPDAPVEPPAEPQATPPVAAPPPEPVLATSSHPVMPEPAQALSDSPDGASSATLAREARINGRVLAAGTRLRIVATHGNGSAFDVALEDGEAGMATLEGDAVRR